MPRGGRRPGAGRKPKPKIGQDAIGYGLGLGARVLPHPSVPPTTNELPPIDEFDAPDDLTMEERQIWLKQAPHAFQNRTLVRSTALSFERYCKVVVLERNEAKSSGVGGANHRGLLKQVNEFELQFGLAPNGRPMLAAPQASAEPQSKLARFRQ